MPHDLWRTAITRAPDSWLTYRQVRMISKHEDPKTVMSDDHCWESLELNAAYFIDYQLD